MTQDEIRKLLGGYATNALTADERRILFEAALEDQELFNTLQNEDALVELLADPVSREQVRRAIETPVEGGRRSAFWSRRWVLGVAIPAVAAVIVIAVMNHANAPRLIAPPVQIASNQVASKEAPTLVENEPPAKKQSEAKPVNKVARATPVAAPMPAPVVPAPSQLDSARNAKAAPAAKFLVAAPSAMPEAIRQRFEAGFAANAPLYQGPLVRYSVVRTGPAGDAVRVEVSTQIAGYLALYRLDAAGNSTRVYPADDAAARVLPDVAMQIPVNPIQVGGAEKLRLVVVPASSAGVAGQLAAGSLGGAVNGAALGTGNAPLPAQPTPLVVEIPLGPN